MHQQQPYLAVGVNIADLFPAVRRAKISGFRGRIIGTLHAIEADLIDNMASQAELLDGVIATNRLSCQLIRQLSSVPADRIFMPPMVSAGRHQLVNCVQLQNILWTHLTLYGLPGSVA